MKRRDSLRRGTVATGILSQTHASTEAEMRADLDRFRRELGTATDWVEVDLARPNPVGEAMDADPATVVSVLQETKKMGKVVIGMKILGAGKLRDRVDEALQYALAQGVLDCFTIGAESPRELEDLLKKIPAASVRA